jgi:hypothetical protein
MLTDVVCVACHPTKAEFAVLGRCGTLQRWDAARHLLLTSRAFTKSPGAHAAYSRDGSFLAVAFDAGYVHVLNTDDLQDVHATRNTPHNVLRVATSATGRHLALADAANQVLLYAHLPYKHIMRWEFVGEWPGRCCHVLAKPVSDTVTQQPCAHLHRPPLATTTRLLIVHICRQGAAAPWAGGGPVLRRVT